MRPFILLFIILNGVSYCAVGQLKATRHYSFQDGLCSKSVILDSAGYFFHEWGCEGRSNISFGKYRMGRDNIINFRFLPFDSIAPIKKVTQVTSKESSDSIVTFSFYDRFGEPLNTNFGIRVADTSNKVHEMWTDEKGQIQLNRFIYKNITLIQFLSIYGEAAGITLENKSLNVYLNLPKVFLDYPELTLDKPRKLNLKLKPNGLYDPKKKTIVFKLN